MPDLSVEAIRRELRAMRPDAPAPLRQRVLGLAASSHEPRRSGYVRFLTRRAALIVVLACLAVSLAGAAIYGLSDPLGAMKMRPNTETVAESARGEAKRRRAAPGGALDPAMSDAESRRLSYPATALSNRASAIAPPSRDRLQNYAVGMRLRVRNVDALSSATQRALRITRSLGGYVVAVDYGTPSAKRGAAYLELRVPVGRIQSAVTRLSSLGTIAAQHVSIADVQGSADTLTQKIRAQRKLLARIDARLRDPGVAAAERAALEQRRITVRRALSRLGERRGRLVRRASFATISLTLTTKESAKRDEAAPGRLERAARSAGSLLVRELAIALYALIVLSPLLVAGLLALLGARVARRRTEQRLLAEG